MARMARSAIALCYVHATSLQELPRLPDVASSDRGSPRPAEKLAAKKAGAEVAVGSRMQDLPPPPGFRGSQLPLSYMSGKETSLSPSMAAPMEGATSRAVRARGA
jgi:hypothetical protein